MYLFYKKGSLKIMGLSEDKNSMTLPSIFVKDVLKNFKGLSLKKVDGKILLEKNQDIEEIVEDVKIVDKNYKEKRTEVVKLMESAGNQKLSTKEIQRSLFYLLRNLNNKKR